MSKQESPAQATQTHLYRAVWRWHFYAGVFVIPFLLTLSLSGLLMLVSKPLTTLFQQHLIAVEATGDALPASTLLTKVQENFPDAAIKLYLPAQSATETTRFSIESSTGSGHGGHGAPSTTVFINPYNAEILGTEDPDQSFYTQVQSFHSSLYLGKLGETLVEIAAGLAILMVVSGLYLAWPREGWRSLAITMAATHREDWKKLHRLIGLVITIPLLFFLISGLAWTNVWGGMLVQPWSSLPGTRYESPAAEQTSQADHANHSQPHTQPHTQLQQHVAMNQHGLHQVPWALEQTPMPMPGEAASGSETTATATTTNTAINDRDQLNLDAVTAIARVQGFTNYRVHLPQSETGVWTVSATTIAGDLSNPLGERILHLDRFSGNALAEISFADYPAIGKAMAAFVPLHQGDLGLWNWLLNLLFVMMVLLIIVSGVMLWWKRRPTRTRKLSPPTATATLNRSVVAIMLVIALCFPLSAAALALVIFLDWLFISRVESMRAAIK